MKELYLLAVQLHVKGISKDLKQLNNKTGAVVDYLRGFLTEDERTEIIKQDFKDLR